MSLKVNAIAIFGGFGASVALGISAFTLTRHAFGQADGANGASTVETHHSCSHPRVGKELKAIAQRIRADGLIVISPVATGLRLAERESAIHALETAVMMWNRALNSATATPVAKSHPVQLIVSEDNSNPDVQIEFSRVPYAGGKAVSGAIRWRETSQRGHNDDAATSTLLVTVGTFTSQGDRYSPTEVTNTIAHQVGHTLGLSDLPRTGGIMDSAGDISKLKTVTGDDFAELQRVLSGRDRQNCQKQPDGRWIY